MSFGITQNEIQKLFDKELEKANKVNQPFHSLHEGYAVLLEEIDEAKIEMEYIEKDISFVWQDIKNNLLLEPNITYIKDHTICLIQEAIQIGAMCDKFLDFLKKN